MKLNYSKGADGRVECYDSMILPAPALVASV